MSGLLRRRVVFDPPHEALSFTALFEEDCDERLWDVAASLGGEPAIDRGGDFMTGRVLRAVPGKPGLAAFMFESPDVLATYRYEDPDRVP